jgi:transcriptional regulator with XRE-family HTH domain
MMLRIKLLRLDSGLTQIEAARRLGMSHLTFGYLETGRLAPTSRDLERLRRHFGDRADSMFEEVGSDLGVIGGFHRLEPAEQSESGPTAGPHGGPR